MKVLDDVTSTQPLVRVKIRSLEVDEWLAACTWLGDLKIRARWEWCSGELSAINLPADDVIAFKLKFNI
jgi:hypothetical protein